MKLIHFLQIKVTRRAERSDEARDLNAFVLICNMNFKGHRQLLDCITEKLLDLVFYNNWECFKKNKKTVASDQINWGLLGFFH